MRKFFITHRLLIKRILLFLVASIIILIILPKERKFEFEFREGKPWLHEDLLAPFDFPIQKTVDQIESEKGIILNSHHPYFRFDKGDKKEALKKFRETFIKEWKANHKTESSIDSVGEHDLKVGSVILDTLLSTGILTKDKSIEGKTPDFHINVVFPDNTTKSLPISRFFTVQTADTYIKQQLTKQKKIDKSMLVWIIEDGLIQNVTFDEKTNNQVLDESLNKISSTYGLIQKGEKIISKGELVSKEKFKILRSLKMDFEGNAESQNNFYSIFGGQIILVAFLMIILFFTIYRFEREVYEKSRLIFLLMILIVLELLMFKLIVNIEARSLYLIPICLLAVILRVFYSMRLSVVAYTMTMLLLAFQAPNSFEFFFLQLIAGYVVLVSLFHIHKRSQFFTTSVWIFLSYALVYTAFILIQGRAWEEIKFENYLYFAISAIFTFTAYPIIFLFEKIFRLITDVTLLELSNTNTSILRRLSLKAPGTFQHSLQVANLAEEAAFAIGANPLLVRTGALYHDIGKMLMPSYFTENQKGGYNPHDELTYKESAKIIISHVIKGIELAKKHNIPEQIIDFIRTHHGTRQTDYFFILYQRENENDDIDSRPFTYPGPEPFSKETALLMMADSVEAASRSLKQPDEQKINDLVELVVGKQLEKHQFDNANITLREIRKVKKILKKQLMNVYHVRIEYPKG
ncbi:MAG: HD family phosphohydrolase [Hyphomicrobiales bacterium]